MIPLPGLGWRLAGAGVAVALVAAAYHFAPVIGPQARLDRAAAQLAAKDLALTAAAGALRTAAAEIRARDQLIDNQADLASRDAGQAAAFWKGQCRHAFDAGYASRRCAGPEPERLRDLRDLQAAGAFKAPP